MRQYLTFQLGGAVHAVDAGFVNSILDPQPWAPLPRFGTIVCGLVNVRGNVVPLFDPRELLSGARFELPGGAGGSVLLEDGGLIVFEVDNGTHLPFIGMEVDRIGKVTVVEDGMVRPVPAYLSESAARFYEGFCVDGGFGFSVLRLSELVSRESLFAQTEGGKHG